MSAGDVDGLPPTQYLVIEVLAARLRLGEQAWRFPRTVKPALVCLREAGVVTFEEVTSRTYLARLTDAGEAIGLSDTYRPANGGMERLRLALRMIAEYAERRGDLVIGIEQVARIARRALGDER